MRQFGATSHLHRVASGPRGPRGPARFPIGGLLKVAPNAPAPKFVGRSVGDFNFRIFFIAIFQILSRVFMLRLGTTLKYKRKLQFFVST